jgi:hypothetical protein
MSHISRLRKDAWVDTCNLVFGAPFKTFIISTAATALAIYLPKILANESADKMREALISLGWALVANTTVFMGVFLVHLLYVTPKRMVVAAENKLMLAEDSIDALQKARQPRIKAICGRDVEGCVVPNHRGIWYRVRLDLTGNNVSSLEASIVGLWDDGQKVNLHGEYMILSMCMSEQLGQTTTIREGRPEFINLILAPGDAKGLPFLTLKHYPGSVGDRVLFQLNHEYQVDIVLNCDDAHPTLPLRVKLKLKSNEETEEFQLT